MPRRKITDQSGRNLIVEINDSGDIMFYVQYNNRTATLLDIPSPITGKGEEELYKRALKLYFSFPEKD